MKRVVAWRQFEVIFVKPAWPQGIGEEPALMSQCENRFCRFQAFFRVGHVGSTARRLRSEDALGAFLRLLKCLRDLQLAGGYLSQ
jgi:hypothetical protein